MNPHAIEQAANQVVEHALQNALAAITTGTIDPQLTMVSQAVDRVTEVFNTTPPPPSPPLQFIVPPQLPKLSDEMRQWLEEEARNPYIPPVHPPPASKNHEAGVY